MFKSLLLALILAAVLLSTPPSAHAQSQEFSNQTMFVGEPGVHYLSKMRSDGMGGSLKVYINNAETALVSEYNHLEENISLGMLEPGDQIEVVIFPSCKCRAQDSISSEDENLALMNTAMSGWQISFEDADDADFNDLVVEIGRVEGIVQEEFQDEVNEANLAEEVDEPEAPSDDVIVKQDEEYLVPQPFAQEDQLPTDFTASEEVCNGLSVSASQNIDSYGIVPTNTIRNTYFDEFTDTAFVREGFEHNVYQADGTFTGHSYFQMSCVHPDDYWYWDTTYVEPYTINSEQFYEMTGWEFAKDVTRIVNSARSRGNFVNAEYMIVFEYSDSWYTVYFNSRSYSGMDTVTARDFEVTIEN
jgi:hypothetical protein